MAMTLKQMDEMLQPMPGRDAAPTLMPSAAMAMARMETQPGTRDRSRRDANQSRVAPRSRVAASARGILN